MSVHEDNRVPEEGETIRTGELVDRPDGVSFVFSVGFGTLGLVAAVIGGYQSSFPPMLASCAMFFISGIALGVLCTISKRSVPEMEKRVKGMISDATPTFDWSGFSMKWGQKPK